MTVKTCMPPLRAACFMSASCVPLRLGAVSSCDALAPGGPAGGGDSFTGADRSPLDELEIAGHDGSEGVGRGHALPSAGADGGPQVRISYERNQPIGPFGFV